LCNSKLLDAVSAFCAHFDVEVNVAKTEVVVFGHQQYSSSTAAVQQQGAVDVQ
jgi:hypothetical protein